MNAKPQPPSEPSVLGLDAFQQPQSDGLTLDKINAAFAEMLSVGEVPYTEAREDEADEVDADEAPTDELPVDADNCEVSPRTILEAMLFVGDPNNEPLTSERVASLMRGVRPVEIDALVRELNHDYQARNRPYRVESQGAGYRLVLAEAWHSLREQFYGKARQARLSQAAIEVLAAVAYHQPQSADGVARLRGTPSGHILAQLVRRHLLRIERSTGKPAVANYYVTDRFLDLFGMSSLDDLPRSQELDAP